MAQKTKQALIVENNQSFPSNTTGYITPTILRDFNTDIIDSLTTQIEFNENSDAVNNSLASLNAFTASAEGLNTGSLLITASFNNGTRNLTFTKGNSSQFSVNIPDASGSELPTGLVSGSSQIDVTQTQNYSGINQYSDGKVLTYINTQGVVSGSVLRTLPAGTVSSSEQISELGYATTQSLNSFTQSVDDKFTNIGNQSGSWDDVTDITALNTFTQSQEDKNSTLASYTGSNDTKWNTLGGQSGSFVTEAETASFARVDVQNVFTQTQTINADLFVSGTINAYQINTTIESSSVIYSSGSNQFGDELSDVQTLSGSVKVVGELTLNGVGVLTASADISALNSFTSSQEDKNNTLGTYTASVDNSLTSLNTYTGSNDTKWDNIASQSGSWDDVTDISALNTFTASQETKNNTLGVWTGSIDDKFNTIGSQSGSWDDVTDITLLNAFTASQETKNSTLGTYTGSVDIAINALNSFTSSQETKNNTLGGVTQSLQDQLTNIGSQSGSYVTTGTNIFTGNQTITGSLAVSGSATFNGSISDTVRVLSITALTASLNASVGNTFQLGLVDATDTRLEISNARVGQTLNLLVSQSAAGTGTLSFGSNLYESSGSFYSASAVGNAKDIITLATFLETNVIYVANIKNLIL